MDVVLLREIIAESGDIARPCFIPNGAGAQFDVYVMNPLF